MIFPTNIHLLARRRGILFVIYMFFKGIARGEPVYIGIAVAIVLAIGGWALFKYLKAQ